jgi:Protein of unknown function (DUF551)
MEWIATSERLPADQQRVLVLIPGNQIYLPGKTGETELREVLLMRFCKDFYPIDSEKGQKHGLHFWAGEGNSNRFFSDITHWMPLPEGQG